MLSLVVDLHVFVLNTYVNGVSSRLSPKDLQQMGHWTKTSYEKMVLLQCRKHIKSRLSNIFLEVTDDIIARIVHKPHNYQLTVMN